MVCICSKSRVRQIRQNNLNTLLITVVVVDGFGTVSTNTQLFLAHITYYGSSTLDHYLCFAGMHCVAWLRSVAVFESKFSERVSVVVLCV